ncbi:CDC48 family AAA ATPase [Fretibacterium sp. OH1220_COT-178]|uniref:CDC48 family AAA ATPase n=1 Tax=Fretibacterium sp. OH1220_COT-178 TaxID=2491047 RepID=UPI000F5DD66A|nr:CDC48 family AAA ATPase [Fretibacterium sp. OH1220_COT-178]RRD65676.1 AAA family ATPase [Fretibacterium sp. OH1220_COT-178]
MFTVKEARPGDALKGIARMNPSDMEALGLSEGQIIEIVGKKTTAARVRACEEDCAEGSLQIDGLMRENALVSLDDTAEVRLAAHHFAGSVSLQPLVAGPLTDRERDSAYILSLLEGQPLTAGDRVRLNLFGTRICDFMVAETTPGGAVVVSKSTYLNLLKPANVARPRRISYEDIGGLGSQIRRVREMIELPLRFPQVFERLGIQPPKGVLLYGPPGTGKTVIARAVANETDAWFTHISGPEIIGKFYGESEERLRNIFEEAQSRSPSIIFIDEIDAIAPKREDMGGEKQVERRVVAQLLALMDGLESRGQIIVIGATNIPNSLDPALRRPGRFDREIAVPIPDRKGRLEILQIHTRGMPLSGDVDLKRVADLSHGFVGADLEALAKEAAMACVRDILPYVNLQTQEIPYEKVASLEVRMGHFMAALMEIDPSAIREVFVEIPDVSWEDVGGLEEIKEELINAVSWPLQHAELFERYAVQPTRGIMLHGPSGTGKTLLAKALAKESGVNFISVKGPSLMSRYVGESERAIREVFRTARQAAPSILYFDEIESLVPIRGREAGGSAFTERVIGQFMSEMSGIEDLQGVVVLATTNRLDLVDPALLVSGRFDLVLELPLPDAAAREEIFRIELRQKPLAPDIDIKALAALTEGTSGADIAFVCRKATTEAIKTLMLEGHGELRLERPHFDTALRELGKRER